MSSRPLAQRRQREPHDVEPEEQVLAELALAHHLLEVAVGRGDEPHVERRSASSRRRARSRFVSRKRSSFTCVEAEISPISSRNSVPPSADSKRPDPSLGRAGERAALVAEELALEQISGSAAQLTATNGARARGLAWWIACAISSLPVPVSPSIRIVGARRRDELHWSMTSCSFGEVPMMPSKLNFSSSALVQLLHLDLERLGLERALDEHLQPLDVDRLGEKIDRAALHRLDGGLDVAVRGHHHDRGPVRQRERLVDDLEAGFARHAEIGEDDVERLRVHAG